MMLIEETTVPDVALPVEEFKAHLRLGSGFTTDSVQDAVLASFLRAALAAVEARTGKVLLERDFTCAYAEWRRPDQQALPVAPVLAVTNCVQVDRAGNRVDVPTDQYWLQRDMHAPQLRAVHACLPNIPEAGSVEVAFRAGFGIVWADIPADLQHAVKLLAAHYYEFRDETALSEGCMPFGVSSLIERYRVMRLSAGRVA